MLDRYQAIDSYDSHQMEVLLLKLSIDIDRQGRGGETVAVIRVSRRWFATYRSIQQAIRDAEPGSRIEVEPGVYREDIVINKYIEIVGIGNKEKIVIQGIETATIYMATGYAVVKNITLKYSRKKDIETVFIPDGALVLEDCDITARSGNGVTILSNEAEPILRRCTIYSKNRAAVEVQNPGKIIIEDCDLATDDYASVVILEGNPTIRRCTIMGDEGHGIYVSDQGRGLFEECNIYGFDYSPAIGILRGNPHFIRCRIHDCKDSGVVIEEGRGRFQECHFFSFDKNLPAVRLSKKAQPRFEKCIFQDCKGGALLFETEASGLIEDCDCYGFTHAPALTIQTDANPQIIRCQIHDGDAEGVLCRNNGKGLLESCEIYSFNGDIISITELSQLDLLRCRIAKGYGHGVLIAQKSKGTFQDTHIEQLSHLAAIHVKQAADPKVINCRVSRSIQAVRVTENGHGLFEKCVFTEIVQEVWEIEDGNPQIHLCKEEGDKLDQDASPATAEPFNVNPAMQKWLHQLEQIIGQSNVKKELREFILYLDYLQDRKKLGIKTTEHPDLHAVFVGSAQTGKPDVAPVYSGLLHELGYISQEALTTIKGTESTSLEDWSNQMKQVTAGLLYIEGLPRFGEATTKKELLLSLKTYLDTTRHLGSTVVILSTDEREWKKWCQTVPSFGALRQYHFQDYTPDEMSQLFQMIAEREDYMIHLLARDVLQREMTYLWKREDGQDHLTRVYDFFEQVKIEHSVRCAKLPKHMRTREILTTFMAEDLMRKGQRSIRPEDQDWVKHIRKK